MVLRVLIPDAECDITLDVVRCLRRFSFEIHLISKYNWVESKFLKGITKFQCIPYDSSGIEYIDEIRKYCEKHNIDVLLPVYTSKIKFFSKHKKKISHFVNVLLPDYEYFILTNNKCSFDVYLDQMNLSKPQTYTNDEQIKSFPIIIKPSESLGGINISKLYSLEQLKNNKLYLREKAQYLLQEFVTGYDFGISVLCKNGKILAFTIQKSKIKLLESFKPLEYIDFIHEEKILEIAKLIFHELNWDGVAHMDLIYDEKKNKFVIIEINPRYWGSMLGSQKVGVNFPVLHCFAALNISFKSTDFREESYAKNRMYLKMLLMSFFQFKSIRLPDHNSLSNDLADPLPILYKYCVRFFRKVFPKSKFLRNRFKIMIVE